MQRQLRVRLAGEWVRWQPRWQLFVRISRLRRPHDLFIVATLGLWGLWLGAEGVPDFGVLFPFLLGTALMRCAAWVVNDLAEAKFLPSAPESCVARGLIGEQDALRLFTGLCGAAFVCMVLLGSLAVMFAPLAWAAAIGYPLLKRFSPLSQLVLVFAFAWTVPMGYFAVGAWPDKTGWLAFVAALLWAAGFTTLYSVPRRDYEARIGASSLPHLVGGAAIPFALLTEWAALPGLWLAGQQAKFGPLFDIGVLVAGGLVVYRAALILGTARDGVGRAYHQTAWIGVAVWAGIALHYVCVSQTSC